MQIDPMSAGLVLRDPAQIETRPSGILGGKEGALKTAERSSVCASPRPGFRRREMSAKKAAKKGARKPVKKAGKKSARKSSAKEPWEKPAPQGSGHTKLTPASKAKAKKAAKKAGRKYPSLVDNMNAAKEQRSSKSQKKG